jgi:DNA polymerase III alpha subunit
VLSGALDGLAAFSDTLSREGEAKAETEAAVVARPELLWAWESLRGELVGEKGAPFAARAELELFSRPAPPCPKGDYLESEKLLDEAGNLRLLVSGHPARLFSQRARRAAASRGLNAPIDSRRIPDCVGRMVTVSGTRAAAKEVLTANGEPMAFVSFEDEYGIFETVLFPKAYARFMPILEMNAAFLIVGLVQDDSGSLSIEVRDLIGLSRPAALRVQGAR